MRRLFASLLAAASCAGPRPHAPAAEAKPPASSPAPPAVAEPRGAPATKGLEEPTVRTPAQLARDAELAKRAAAVIDAYQNHVFGFGGALSHDGRRVVFGSNRDGSPQLYAGEVRRPADPPVAITTGPERVLSAVLSRDGTRVLFTRDMGADENARIFAVSLDGKGTVELTPEQGVRHDPPLLPLRRKDLMLYTRRKVTSPATTVLVQPIAGGPGRVVHEEPTPAFLADVSPDGTRALLVRVRSASDLTLLELDVGGGGVRRVHPPEGKAEAIGGAAYSADGKTIFVATDQGGEATALLALDAATGAPRGRWAPTPATATVDQVVASPAGDVLAVRVNAGDRTEVHLLAARALSEKVAVKLPAGSCELGEFTPDGRRLAFSLATPDGPWDPWGVDVRTGSAARLREDVRPGAVTPVDVVRDAPPAFDGKPIPVHAYLPKDRGERRLPVIAWFHGGPSASSEIRWSTWAQFFVGQGYAWVEPNVRGSTGFGRAWEMADNREKRGDVLKDMEAVNRWIRAQPWADGDRVVIFGGSYGGWVVLMGLTRQQPLWRAGVDLVGVADLRTLLASTDQLIRAIFVDEFGDLDADRDLLAAWSPLPDAGKIAAPLFVYQGANDPRVPRAESDAIVGAVRANGRPVEYMIAPDEGHSLDRRANQVEFFARTARFLGEHLR
jgi:Tol biopolymer transport system component/dienelactone hydrolase